MAINNTLSELDKYQRETNDLSDRVTELSRYHKQADEFCALEVALRAERKELSSEILEAAGNPDHMIERLEKLDRGIRLNQVSSEALQEKIHSRERFLHMRTPLAIKAFGTLREWVVGETLQSCREAITKLIDPGMPVADEHVDAIALAMPDYIRVSQLTLPSVSWTITRPLDEKPIYWSSITRPYTEAELREMRDQTVKCILSATNELCEAARPLVVAAGPYAEHVPEFKCEAEPPPPPAQPDPKHLEWLQPLGGSDEEWAKQICETAGKPYPPVNPTDIEILERMLANRHANPVSHGVVTSAMVGSTSTE